jgi:hypothetical protein
MSNECRRYGIQGYHADFLEYAKYLPIKSYELK